MGSDQVRYLTEEDASTIIIEAYQGFGFAERRFYANEFTNIYCPLKTVSMETLFLQ